MGLFTLSSKTGDASISFPHHEGVPGFMPGTISEIILHDDESRIEIKPKFFKKLESVYLPYSKIVGVLSVTEKEITEQGKSVLGRAMLGGVLLGPLGAVVGGMSGTTKKTKTSYHPYFIINYKPDMESDEVRVLTFINNGQFNVSKFVNLIKERAGITDQVKSSGPITL
ncbi:MAG: hypothetical protein WBL80_03945 [Erysipelotrichaceae bacterium]